MRRDSKVNPFEAKRIARQKYIERQIDKFIKWSWEVKGKVKSSDIEQLHNRHGIMCYTQVNYNE
jgi:plasmid rolling circle replication initiator protein Rep